MRYELDETDVGAALEDLAEDGLRRSGEATLTDFDSAVARYELTAHEAAELLSRAVATGTLGAPADELNPENTALVQWRTRRADGGVPEAFDLFLARAGRYPLLTAERERQLARILQTAALGPADGADGAALMERGRRAKEEFICANIRLVISVAKRYKHRGLDLPDLVQYGIIGLNRAVELFDYRRGFKFSTYATHWIEQSVERNLANFGRAIRLPVHQDAKLRKIMGVRVTLERQLDHEPSLEEVAARAGLDAAEVAFLLDAARMVLSLDAPLTEDGAATHADLLIADDPPMPDVMEAMERRETVHHALHRLSYRERRVIEMRFGIGTDEPRTLDEIGRTFNVTRERVRQIEKQAKEKLALTLSLLAPGTSD